MAWDLGAVVLAELMIAVVLVTINTLLGYFYGAVLDQSEQAGPLESATPPELNIAR